MSNILKRKEKLDNNESQIRVEACVALRLLFENLRTKKNLLELDKDFSKNFYDCIKEISYNKIPKIRHSAKSVLEAFIKVYKIDSVFSTEIQNADMLDDVLSVKSGKSGGSSRSLKLKEQRDTVKRIKIINDDYSESPDHKRGQFLIESSLNDMTKGKGWGCNVRGKNYQKGHSGFAGGFCGESIELESRRREKSNNIRKKRFERRKLQELDIENARKSG